MILFHGSNKVVERPAANYGRDKVDFAVNLILTKMIFLVRET